MPTRDSIERYLAYLKDEQNAAALYRALAEVEKDPHLAEVYRRLAETEEGHAGAWAERLEEAGVTALAARTSWQTRVLGWLAERCRPGFVLPTLVSVEQRASRDYARQPEAKDLVADQRSHAFLFGQINQSAGSLAGAEVAQLEGRHRAAGGNALRAAVLGASDGLLSNFNLVMGVAGASLSAKSILLTGIAGLLAGAISMALGEWISVQSSRELYQKQLSTEEEEIAAAPEAEAEELALIYQARGMEEASARSLAGQIMKDCENALETLAREELGIDPKELGGSAWEAAFTSFALFAAGAVVPVIPYVFMKGVPALATSAALSAAALFVVGAAITLFTGRPVLRSGLRQVLFGLAAATFTFLVGRLIGASLAG